MKVLVTGGAGFIGSHLVEALLARGCEVRVLDNFFSGKWENLAAVLDDIELLVGDVRDPAMCKRACAGVERVWHLAAIGSVPFSIDDPVTAHDVNTTGTLNMLVAARDAGVQRLVFASSCAVYGANPTLPREETQNPLPVSPYAINKLAAEFYVRQFAELYGFETAALRFFNVFGPRQDPNSQYAAVVPKFFDALLSGEQPKIFGDGEQSREFIYVKDCVHGNLQAGFHNGPEVVGNFFNLAPGCITTVNELLATVQGVLGTDIPPRFLPALPGEVRYSDANIEKAIRCLDFHPQWTLEAGLRETDAWFAPWHAAHLAKA